MKLNSKTCSAVALSLSLASSMFVAAAARADDPIVAQKLKEEKQCLKKRTGPARASCLSALADWWWSESVNYDIGSHDPILEIHRILGTAIVQNPADVDLFTNFTWIQYSVDINAIQDHKATDVTTAVIDKINEYSAFHVKDFNYYWQCVDQALLFTLPNGLPSLAMKNKYLDFAQTLQDRAKQLWVTFKQTLTADEQQRVQFTIDATDRAIAHRRTQLDALNH